MTQEVGEKVQIVGDDLLVTNPKRVEKAIKEKSCNALLLKVSSIWPISALPSPPPSPLSAEDRAEQRKKKLELSRVWCRVFVFLRTQESARTTQLNTLGPQELSDSTWQWMVLVQVPANSTFTNSTACIVEWEAKGFKVSGSICDPSSRTEIQQLIDTVSSVLDGRLNIFAPGVPLMYGLHKALLLESPSTFQCEFAKSIEEKRLHMSEVELKMLGMKKKNVPATEEARESFDANEAEGVQTTGSQAETKMKLERKRLQVKDSTQFKRKKPKGPNPLSCKKKSEKPNSRSAKEPKNDAETLRNRSMKRKRSRGSKKPKEANS